MLRGLADLHGITFAAKVRVEPANDPRYSDSNRLDRVVLPGEPEYAKVMAGEGVRRRPATGRRRPAAAAPRRPPGSGTATARACGSAPMGAPPPALPRRAPAEPPAGAGGGGLVERVMRHGSSPLDAAGAAACCGPVPGAPRGCSPRSGASPHLRAVRPGGEGLRLTSTSFAGEFPHHRFCSMRCCEAGGALGRRSNGVIDKTQRRQRAVKDARRPLAEVLVA